jgi:hypothetical protein
MLNRTPYEIFLNKSVCLVFLGIEKEFPLKNSNEETRIYDKFQFSSSSFIEPSATGHHQWSEAKTHFSIL